MEPEKAIRDAVNNHIEAAAAILETQIPALIACSERLVRCLLEENRIFVCGSGGSAANAQHFSVKMMGRLERERPALPVFCLSDGAALLTSLSGSYGNDDVFARPLRALGQPGDVLVALSSTGMSANTVQAIVSAHDRNMDTIALTGHEGGDIALVLKNNDLEIRVSTTSMLRAEEIHLLLINTLCDLLERKLFGDNL